MILNGQLANKLTYHFIYTVEANSSSATSLKKKRVWEKVENIQSLHQVTIVSVTFG